MEHQCFQKGKQVYLPLRKLGRHLCTSFPFTMLGEKIVLADVMLVFGHVLWEHISLHSCIIKRNNIAKKEIFNQRIWYCLFVTFILCWLCRMSLGKDPLFWTGLYAMTPYLKATNYLLLNDPFFWNVQYLYWSPFYFEDMYSMTPIFISKACTQWPPFLIV